MSWTPEAWKSWGARLKTDWTETLEAAWTDIRNAAGAEIEADPEGAARDAAAFHDKLFGGSDAPGGPGIWYNIGYQWAKEKELGPERSAFLYEQVAVQLRAKGHDVTAAELTGDAASKRAQEMTLGFLKDAKLQLPAGSQTPGFVPLLIAGVLVVGFVGACWARVRMAQANVELDRTALSRESLARVDQASKEGRKLDGATVAAIVGAAAAPNQNQDNGSGGGGLGLVAVLGLGAVVAGGAFLLTRRS